MSRLEQLRANKSEIYPSKFFSLASGRFICSNMKKGLDEYVLRTDAGESSAYIIQLITRSFSHYVAKAGLRPIVFKDLRKTYISHLTVAMGGNAKMYTGHTGDSRVVEQHYLSQSYLSSKLKDFEVL